MSDLDELRQKRLRELMSQQPQQENAVQERLQSEQVNQQIKLIINQIMTPEARERLGNLRIARPDFARQVEILLIQLYQTRKLPGKVDDNLLKSILLKISSQKRETKIVK